MGQAILYYATLALEALVGVFGIRLYQEPPYDIVDRLDSGLEIRRYAPRLAAEVELPVAGGSGRDEAFRLLFAYIAGANRPSASQAARIAMTMPVEVSDKQRIAMTVPVQTGERSDTVRMRFFLPAKYTHNGAPKPADVRVRLVPIPDETIAILRFSGSGRDDARHQADLMTRLAASRWQPAGQPYTLYYDAPFTLPFLRRNEAAVTVAPAL
jgi:hypothetical protein